MNPSTKICVLEVIRYPPDSEWKSTEIDNPRWEDIEESVRQLDRDEWPFLFLHTSSPVEGEMPENGLCIMGGRGEYSVYLTDEAGTEIRFEDTSRDDEPIQVWESDQGSIRPRNRLCNDVDIVLAIAKFFSEEAKLHPDFSWRES